ncbi:MAG: cobalt transporter CbiM [Desulfovibrio sp.]|nr:cobalt transporter CbiM [Desulfovibrio sp.]
MHIAEGVLAPSILCGGAILTAVGTILGGRKLKHDQGILAGILAAVFFIASLVHIPIGVTSAHLLGTGIVGIFLGLASFPALLIALFLQALFFQYGGFTMLGVNCATMAGAAWLAGLLFHAIYPRMHTPRGFFFAGFLAGFAGVCIAALLTACALAFSEEGFVAAAQTLVLVHIPVMLAEGVLTGFIVSFIAKVRPNLLRASYNLTETYGHNASHSDT